MKNHSQKLSREAKYNISKSSPQTFNNFYNFLTRTIQKYLKKSENKVLGKDELHSKFWKSRNSFLGFRFYFNIMPQKWLTSAEPLYLLQCTTKVRDFKSDR